MSASSSRPGAPAHASPDEGSAVPRRIGSYRVTARLGEGASGVVYSARRDDSDVDLALKVIRPGLESSASADRFKREATLLRGLHHPGIAALYDAGEATVDIAGTGVVVPFLAMELIDGVSLRHHAEMRALDVDQRVELIARLCEALEHAHAAGVVHRDLKPANILVVSEDTDPVGQPKVLDFGVACAISADAATLTALHAESLVGTVPYMSPEQFQPGRTADRRTDVYTLGVLLFELLTGRLPYEVRGCTLTESARLIQSEPPARLRRYAKSLAGDLELIVLKALEKEPDRRYATAGALARDLRAYGRREPVTARSPSLARRAVLWVRRRRVVAGTLAVTGVALFVTSSFFLDALEASRESRLRESTALRASSAARERQADVEAQRSNLISLSDELSLQDLIARADELWPLHPDKIPEFVEWIAEAESLLTRLPAHEAFLENLREGNAQVLSEISARQRGWWILTLEALVDDLTSLGAAGGTLADVRRRLESSSTLRRRSIEDHESAWAFAIEDIATSTAYGGLRLTRQMGLVPLDKDPRSGLWEFWIVESGEVPERDEATGQWVMEEGTGIVLVLIPGGSFLMGSPADPGAPHYFPDAYESESPQRATSLSPFFLSKFEMTQGQWLVVDDTNPSEFAPGRSRGEPAQDLRHPVEQVSWSDCVSALKRLGLELPSEAQWEYSARAGTETIWSTGDDSASLEGVANLKDRAYERLNGRKFAVEYFEPWDDGYATHAPVGTFAPNAFGLHDVHGNVWEWCADVYVSEFGPEAVSVDPCHGCDRPPLTSAHFRCLRGGDFSFRGTYARSARRYYRPFTFGSPEMGVRPMRRVDP